MECMIKMYDRRSVNRPRFNEIFVGYTIFRMIMPMKHVSMPPKRKKKVAKTKFLKKEKLTMITELRRDTHTDLCERCLKGVWRA